ncbi:hypothetical protein ACFFRR_008976 [Megaselia abdita]
MCPKLKYPLVIFTFVTILISIKVYKAKAAAEPVTYLSKVDPPQADVSYRVYTVYPMRRLSYPSHRFHRRFMWKDMDDTMDNIYDGIASGAKALKHTINNMLTLRGPRSNHHPSPQYMDYLLPQQSYVKYVYKKPAKHIKIIKIPAKKPVLKTTTTTTHATPDEHKFTSEEQYFDKDKLRKLEIAEERRVEATMSSALKATEFYPNEIVSGQIKVSDDDSWAPVTGFTPSGFTTSKQQSYPVSELHTHIGAKTANKMTTYEVTEHSGEESVNIQSTYKTVPTAAKPSQGSQRDYQGYYFRQNSKRQQLNSASAKNKTVAGKYRSPEPTMASDQSSLILKKPSTTAKTKMTTQVSDLYAQISALNIGSPLKQEHHDSQTTQRYQKLPSEYTPKIRVKKNQESRESRGSIKYGEKF